MIRHTARALGFLSRIPVPGRYFAGPSEPVSASAAMFPIAGVAIAVPAAAATLLGSAIQLPLFVTATFAIAVLTFTIGALHEDGLADVADGFFGASDSQQRLEIMKDSSIGTYGALALVFSMLLRIGAFAAILEGTGALAAVATLIGTAAASRAAMVWFWSSLPSARYGGVADRAGTPSRASAYAAVAAGAAVFAVALLPALGLIGPAIAVLLTAVALSGFRAVCIGKIGGQTGDTLGAAQQIAEMSLLTGLVIAI